MTIKRLHRYSAIGLAAFIALHVTNHVVGALFGPNAHLAMQSYGAVVYRAPFVEPLLIASILIQIYSGVSLAMKRGWPNGFGAKVQTISGLYLASFLLMHVGAVMAARWGGVETNLYFAAAGIHAGGIWPWLFIPYYAGAILAIGAHLSIAIVRLRSNTPVYGWIGGILSVGICVLVMAFLAGGIHDLEVPQPFLLPYQ